MIRLFIFTIALTFPSMAPADYFNRQSDQFGFVRVDIGSQFRLDAMCTVSNGEIDNLESYVEWIPNLGGILAKSMKFASLRKGVSVCGLRQSKKKDETPVDRLTNGFELEIRTYLASALIGTDSPTMACDTPYINKTSLCFEYVKLKENDDRQEAEAVTACIDIRATDNSPALSLVLGAGKIPQSLKTELSNESTALQELPCSEREF